MARMLNQTSTRCPFCRVFAAKGGRARDGRLWRREWDDEQRSVDREHEVLDLLADERVALANWASDFGVLI